MVWIQYVLADPSQISWVNQKVDDAILSVAGKGQIYYAGNPDGVSIDITQNPPTLIFPPESLPDSPYQSPA